MATTLSRADLYRAFIERLPIRRKDLSIGPLTFNPAQELVWTKYIAPCLNANKKIWLIVLKARRLGMSTLIEGLMLADTVFRNHVHSLVMASKQQNTKEIWEMARRMVKQSALAPLAHLYNRELHFGKSKYLVATAGTEDTMRGFDLTNVHGSEVGFWPKPETWLATVQCIPDHIPTICVLESTANGKVGMGELFYDEWGRAVDGQSDFQPVFLPWHSFNEYAKPEIDTDARLGHPMDAEELELVKAFHLSIPQLAWRRWAIRNKCQGDLDRFHQEYPATADEAFVSSGLPFFPKSSLLWMESTIQEGVRHRVTVNGVLKPDPLGPIWVYQKPESGHRYVIGADSSMGMDADEGGGRAKRSRSACEVLDMETLEQVAEYDATTPPHIQAAHLAGLGRAYHTALLAPEVQSSGGGGGREIIAKLHELDYYHIHEWWYPDRKGPKKSHILGWETNARTRPMMLMRLREVVDERACIIHSRRLLKQLHDFGESDAGRQEALQGHDDLLFAYGIAIMSRFQNYSHYKSQQPDAQKINEASLKWLHAINLQNWAESSPEKKAGYLVM